MCPPYRQTLSWLQLVPPSWVIHSRPLVPTATPCVSDSNPTREKLEPGLVSTTCQACPVSAYRSGPELHANHAPLVSVTPCACSGGGVLSALQLLPSLSDW